MLDAALLQALASPSLSSQSTYDHLARGSFDLRQSMDLRTSLDLATAMSARTSLDLSSLQQNLAAASQGLGGYDAGTRMRAADSHSTLASSADGWSAAPSARTSLDAALLPVTAGFLSSAAPALQTRLSLDAALQLHHAQQALLASQAHAGYGGMPPLPPGGPQQNISSVMHSGFYQPAAAPQQQPEAVQHDISTVMSSGFYGGGARPPVPPVRHSMHEFSSSGYGRSTASLPFADNGWGAPAPAPPAPAGTLGGYSTVLRPSFDRSGLPPLAPRSPNQGEQGVCCTPAGCMQAAGVMCVSPDAGQLALALHPARLARVCLLPHPPPPPPGSPPGPPPQICPATPPLAPPTACASWQTTGGRCLASGWQCSPPIHHPPHNNTPHHTHIPPPPHPPTHPTPTHPPTHTTPPHHLTHTHTTPPRSFPRRLCPAPSAHSKPAGGAMASHVASLLFP